MKRVKKIIQKKHTLKLSTKDTMLLVKALDGSQTHPRLKQAIKNYETKTQEEKL